MSCGIYESLIYENRSLVPQPGFGHIDVARLDDPYVLAEQRLADAVIAVDGNLDGTGRTVKIRQRQEDAGKKDEQNRQVQPGRILVHAVSVSETLAAQASSIVPLGTTWEMLAFWILISVSSAIESTA